MDRAKGEKMYVLRTVEIEERQESESRRTRGETAMYVEERESQRTRRAKIISWKNESQRTRQLEWREPMKETK